MLRRNKVNGKWCGAQKYYHVFSVAVSIPNSPPFVLSSPETEWLRRVTKDPAIRHFAIAPHLLRANERAELEVDSAQPLQIEKLIIALVADHEKGVGDMGKAILLVEPLPARIVAIDAEQ